VAVKHVTMIPLISCAACRNQAVGERPDLMARFQRNLPTYTAVANGLSIDHGDVGDFTIRILRCLKSHASEIGA
jgi:hypothetical protein